MDGARGQSHSLGRASRWLQRRRESVEAVDTAGRHAGQEVGAAHADATLPRLAAQGVSLSREARWFWRRTEAPWRPGTALGSAQGRKRRPCRPIPRLSCCRRGAHRHTQPCALFDVVWGLQGRDAARLWQGLGRVLRCLLSCPRRAPCCTEARSRAWCTEERAQGSGCHKLPGAVRLAAAGTYIHVTAALRSPVPACASAGDPASLTPAPSRVCSGCVGPWSGLQHAGRVQPPRTARGSQGATPQSLLQLPTPATPQPAVLLQGPAGGARLPAGSAIGPPTPLASLTRL